MRFPTALKKILLLVATAVLSLLVVELLLAGLDYRYRPLDIQNRQEIPRGVWNNPNDTRFLHTISDRAFVFDPLLIWRPRAGADPFNSQGFRGPLLGPTKSMREYRIFAVGDSNTLGWRGPTGASWPGELQKLLGEPGAPFLVINAAAYGYSSYQGLRRFEETLPYLPDLALISFGSNDAHPVAVTDARFVDSAFGPRIRMLSSFRLGQLLLSAWEQVSGSEPAARVFRVPLPAFRANLSRIAEISRERGIACALLTRPYGGTSSDPTSWKTYAPEYRRVTAEIAGDLGLPLIDLYAWFENQPAYFADESHFFPEGHRIAALIVLRQLEGLFAEEGTPPRDSPSGLLPDRLVLDVGEPAARPFLSHGFSGDERDELGSFVWNEGPGSLLMASLDPANGGYDLSVEASCFPPLFALQVDVSVNGRRAGPLRFSSRRSRARLELPPGALRWGPNSIFFQYSALGRPMDVDPSSRDARQLALRFFDLELTPQETGQ